MVEELPDHGLRRYTSLVCERPRNRLLFSQYSSTPLLPGPDLACQDAAMESEAFISSEDRCISTPRRTRAGWHVKMW